MDLLNLSVSTSRTQMGAAAAADVAARIVQLLEKQEEVSVIFAAAPSQLELYRALIDTDVDWSRVNAFHMDEYVGLSEDSPQSFRRYLKEHFFDMLPFRSVHLLRGEADDATEECIRYGQLLEEYSPDLVCLGIGENCHLAFNDPPVANFKDPVKVKRVSLDDTCRQQQVNDGCFPSFDAVPAEALTLTIPTLFEIPYLYCVVPGPSKAQAVKWTLEEPVSERFPSTILRKHPNTTLYLDQDSASLIANG
ncbi:glucosamine-6-phosphate deaminase [Sphingobacterium sp. SYP-B4668]|uniref:glucosamine-6-phosphate deaminase n=1 Tax=Sphingobacterium sp. SYP-B4668 TaxID=2996035 RepID=UPI0022DE8DEE|nr:glucosamine-6-phosphate deaminase [Sphingobacterium sp. SYP-B4668]